MTSVGCREVENGSDDSEREAGVAVANETAAVAGVGVSLALGVDEVGGRGAEAGPEAGA